MNVPLTADQERLIQEKVASGLYGSPDEVISMALRLLEERDRKLEALRKDVQEGLASGIAGPFDEATVERIIAKGRERLALRQKPA
ncbi:MAG: type II toxin-antitoxin system ParD family antitoxin [SAR202 cluster bacterium]|nr:type II toxin-antitoxin system ParD family antitoxin [SAR202 cluster bacterium]